MEKKKLIIGIFFTIICIIGITTILFKNNEVEALSKYGSRGTEVKTIQEKLKRWGYYNGSIDGIYGTQTVNAVKKFQQKNGLTVDGVAGPKTLSAMGINSSSSGSSSGGSSSSNSSDVTLLSKLIYGEARGEPYTRSSCGRSCNTK